MSEWAASFKRGNDLVDSVQVMAEHDDGKCFVLRRTLIAALPEMREKYDCPATRTDLQFLIPPQFLHPQFMRDGGIKRFYLEYAEIAKKDAREKLRLAAPKTKTKQ